MFKLLNKLLKRLPGSQYISRARIAYRYFDTNLNMAFKWVFSSQEDSNFYYPISKLNRNQMMQTLAVALNCKPELIRTYFAELENDQLLLRHVNEVLRKSSAGIGSQLLYGRRIVWYAIARHIKPRLIVETGVADGLGSCVLARALQANQAEGFEGKYIGTEIDERAGRLFSKPYSNSGQIIYGDSLATLSTIDESIDLFISDSDHSENYELLEYESIINKLSPRALILGDNSHVSSTLSDFSLSNQRPFIYINETPVGHWYPGAGVGISLPS